MSLQQIQEKLNAPKDLFNKFAGFKYRSAESILQALKPLLAEHKYSLVISDALELIGDRYYVKATSCLYDDKMTLIAQASAYAREELMLKGQQSSQITGGTSSYARKMIRKMLIATIIVKHQKQRPQQYLSTLNK